MRVAIQGIGPLGGFGCGIAELDRAVEQGREPQAQETASGNALPVFLAQTEALEEYVPKRVLRRVDHFSRMALLGAHMALADADRLDIDRERLGVVVATGYGATRTTFSFLDSVINDGDVFASPTHFSNSVHNAAAANVSMLLKATGPSLTVSQFEMSVPSALLTARQWLREDRVDAVLFGGVDEHCDVLGYCWRRYFGDSPPQSIRPLDFDSQTAVAGEGGAFFLLTREGGDQGGGYALIDDVELGNCAGEQLDLPQEALVILGADGHRRCSGLYQRSLPKAIAAVSYAGLYGSSPAGPALDLAIGALSLRKGRLAPPPGSEAGLAELGQRPVCCVKMGSEGDYGLVTLSANRQGR